MNTLCRFSGAHLPHAFGPLQTRGMMHACMCACACTRMHIRRHARTQVNVCAYVCVCVCIRSFFTVVFVSGRRVCNSHFLSFDCELQFVGCFLGIPESTNEDHFSPWSTVLTTYGPLCQTPRERGGLGVVLRAPWGRRLGRPRAQHHQ